MRKQHDQFFKSLAEADPRGLLDILDILPLDAEAEIEPLDRELIREPVLIDQGFVVREASGDRWIAHIEAFSDVSTEDWDRMLWYAADLAVRTQLEVRSTALLMFEWYEPKVIPSKIEVRRGAFGLSLDLHVVKLWEVPSRRLMLSKSDRLLTWIPLTESNPDDCVEAGNRIHASGNRLLEATFRALGEIRYGKDDWENLLERRGVEMIRPEILIKHSPSLQQAYNEARNEARTEGRSEGRTEGLSEGHSVGLSVGRLEAGRALLHAVTAARFPSLVAAIPPGERLLRFENLEFAVREIATCSSESEALAVLRGLDPLLER